ncbi:uncharacterized protein DS421_17g581330 [Arachis hypogaea]|nr:uncharacterized protein DS421_17g581330 [Arachis hypogaea]
MLRREDSNSYSAFEHKETPRVLHRWIMKKEEAVRFYMRRWRRRCRRGEATSQ